MVPGHLEGAGRTLVVRVEQVMNEVRGLGDDEGDERHRREQPEDRMLIRIPATTCPRHGVLDALYNGGRRETLSTDRWGGRRRPRCPARAGTAVAPATAKAGPSAAPTLKGTTPLRSLVATHGQEAGWNERRNSKGDVGWRSAGVRGSWHGQSHKIPDVGHRLQAIHESNQPFAARLAEPVAPVGPASTELAEMLRA